MRPGLWRCAFAVLLVSGVSAQTPWESTIVFEGPDGALVYVTDAEGNRVPDFSHAGYGGGGVLLPTVDAVIMLAPEAGDDTARIQTALNFVGAQTPDARGLRGAVVLSPGTYEIAGTLSIRRSGVVLRGAGNGDDPTTDTILRRSGTSQDPVLVLGPSSSAGGGSLFRRDVTRDTSLIADALVPIGATSFRVARPEVFASGDPVTVFHPATAEWLTAVENGGTADDPGWAVDEQPISLARTVVRVEGQMLTLDAPTFTQFDASLSPSFVYHRDASRLIENVGVEDLRVHIQTAGPMSEDHAEDAIRFVLVENGWASGVTALHFWHAGISVQHSRYVTVTGCEALEPHSLVTGSRRYNVEVYQSQLVLFEGNRATEARHAYVGNGTSYDSGIVFLDNVSENAFGPSESHRRWGTGFLWDRHVELGTTGSGSGSSARRLHLGNRGNSGTGHGWACANCVAWNAQMNGSSVVVEKPPTAQNYSIGTQGEALDDGPFLSNTGSFIEGTDRPGLVPGSLYLRQLQDRLAATASPPGIEASGVQLRPLAPNPVRTGAVVRFSLGAPSEIRLAVSDALGREVAVLARGLHGAGEHRAALDTRSLAAGVYAVWLAASGERIARWVTVSR